MFSSNDFALHLAVTLFAASTLWSSTVGFNTKGNCSLCKVPKHLGDEKALELLQPLCGQRFSTQDASGEYQYNIGICTNGEAGESQFKTAGAIQTNTKSPEIKTPIGSLDNTEVMAGTNWINLEYEGGESYDSHCTHEERRTIVMITCDPSATVGNLRWVEENRNKTGDCYYLFELDHIAACELMSHDDGGLSAGSIVCIVLATVVGSYLVFGILFMRFVKGAKGLHQIPNFEFWQDVGSLQADGCDLICRCSGNRYAEAKPYLGVGDHQIESANDGEDLDDHLLPM